VQGASVPAVPRPAGPALLAFDGSPGARRAVAEAAGLLAGVPAVVVCVWWRMDRTVLLAGGRLPGVLPPAPELATQHDDAAEQAAWGCARDGAALAAEAGLDARALAVAAETGASLGAALAAAAAEVDASVLVVAERRRPWPARALRRSPARALVDALPCPVLVVPQAPGPVGASLAAGSGEARG